MLEKTQKNSPSKSLARRQNLSQQNILLAFRFCFGARPARKHESNLVDEIRNVVEHIEEGLVHGSEQVAEKVSKRIDRPASSDDHAHVLEGCRNGLAAACSSATSFTSEDLEENVEPAKHTTNEGWPRWEQEGLTEVSEEEHDHGA